MISLPEENSSNEQQLFKFIASGEAILMVGAGSSKIVGYPLWSELVKSLEKEVEHLAEEFDFRKEDSSEDDLVYSSRLKDALGDDRYGALMHQIFDEDKGCDECHVKLLELPFRGILTTNYDHTLETALFKATGQQNNNLVIDDGTTNREINKLFQSLNYGFIGRKIIAHLHGDFKRASSLVLCINDYKAKYGSDDPNDEKWPLHKRILWALMATRKIIYLGFSMTDPFFKMMHQIVSNDLGHFHSNTHFMITRFSTDDPDQANLQLKFAEGVKRNYGIETVFYEDNKEYNGLKNYIYEMSTRVVSSMPTKHVETVSSESKNVKEKNPDLDFTDQLRKKATYKNKNIRENDN